MPIHQTARTILSIAARAIGREASKDAGSKTVQAGLTHLTGSDSRNPPHPSHVAGSTAARGADAGETLAQKKTHKPPMTSSGFLSTILTRHRITASLIAHSTTSAATYSTGGAVETPRSVHDIREFIDTHKSKELSPDQKTELAKMAAELKRADPKHLTPGDLKHADAEHLTAEDKIQISNMAGDFAISLHDEKLLPVLGTISRIHKESGPSGIEKNFENAQKIVIEEAMGNGIMFKLREWATISQKDKLKTVKELAPVICKSFGIKREFPRCSFSKDPHSMGKFIPELNSIAIHEDLLGHSNSVQVVRVLAHELTHAAQYDQMNRLDDPDETLNEPWKSNAMLVQRSTDYDRNMLQPQSRVSQHPDYKLLWHEHQAFHMGDKVAERFAKILGVDFHYEDGVFMVSPKTGARQVEG